jgi:hypothetical protein
MVAILLFAIGISPLCGEQYAALQEAHLSDRWCTFAATRWCTLAANLWCSLSREMTLATYAVDANARQAGLGGLAGSAAAGAVGGVAGMVLGRAASAVVGRLGAAARAVAPRISNDTAPTVSNDVAASASRDITPGQGYHKETIAPSPMKPEDAVADWENLLGPGPYTDIHPRTGLPDPDRLVSANGARSIRFGPHEINSTPTKFHYHREQWTYDPVNNVMNVDNEIVRVPIKIVQVPIAE